MKLNKKALSMISIVFLLIAIFTLLFLLNLTYSKFNNNTYDLSISSCALTFKNAHGKLIFYNKEGKINSNLINLLAISCPSKSINVKEKEINKVSDLILDCFDKSSKGLDIFPNKVKDDGICLYCGTVKTPNEISDFSGKLNENLKKKKYKSLFYTNLSSSVNLNEIYLSKSNIPNSISSQRDMAIYYYIYKPQFPKNQDITFSTYLKDEVLGGALNKISDLGNVPSSISNLIYPKLTQTYSGVIIADQKEYHDGEILNKDRSSLAKKSCTIVTPKKNYE